jgi:hypothetical protein
MLSVAYCDEIEWVPLAKLYSRLLYDKSVTVIILLMLSVLLGPKVNTTHHNNSDHHNKHLI